MVAKLGALVLLEFGLGKGEIVLEKVEEVRVVVLRHTGVVEDESAKGDQRIGCFLAFRLYRNGITCLVEEDVKVDRRKIHDWSSFFTVSTLVRLAR